MNIPEKHTTHALDLAEELKQTKQQLAEMWLHIENIRKFCEIDPDSQAGRYIRTYIVSIPPANE